MKQPLLPSLWAQEEQPSLSADRMPVSRVSLEGHSLHSWAPEGIFLPRRNTEGSYGGI